MPSPGTSRPSPPRAREKDLRLWPWSPRSAVVAVPIALVLFVILLTALKTMTGVPSDANQGWALLAVVLLSLAPVILLMVESIARNRGELRVLGVSLSFAAASREAAAGVSSTTLDENLGTAISETVGRSSLPVVIRTLRRAHDSDVIVIDLKEGATWWESRLFILLAGATRRKQPKAVAFVAKRNDYDGAFLGWAAPAKLLQLHLEANPELATVYALALANTRQWELGTPGPGMPPTVTPPWGGGARYLPPNEGDTPDPEFALELYMNDEIERRRGQQLPQGGDSFRRLVTIQRLLELYESALVTDYVEKGASDEEWINTLRRSHRGFFALTSEGRLNTLVPRDALLTALVLRLAENAAREESAR
jgi:hypothetical protein